MLVSDWLDAEAIVEQVRVDVGRPDSEAIEEIVVVAISNLLERPVEIRRITPSCACLIPVLPSRSSRVIMGGESIAIIVFRNRAVPAPRIAELTIELWAAEQALVKVVGL
jgi:hypothetical protein